MHPTLNYELPAKGVDQAFWEFRSNGFYAEVPPPVWAPILSRAWVSAGTGAIWLIILLLLAPVFVRSHQGDHSGIVFLFLIAALALMLLRPLKVITSKPPLYGAVIEVVENVLRATSSKSPSELFVVPADMLKDVRISTLGVSARGAHRLVITAELIDGSLLDLQFLSSTFDWIEPVEKQLRESVGLS